MSNMVDITYDGFKRGKIELAQSYSIVQEYEDGCKTEFNPDDYIIVSKKLLSLLKEDSDWAACLDEAGVDNWPGISYAYELKEGMEGELPTR